MKMKFGLAALVLAAMPSFAMAACGHGKDRQAMSCAEGMSFDSATGTCQPVASS